jgi:hypothetical protein
VTERSRVAAIAYLGEQMPDFGDAFGPKPCQQRAEMRQRAGLLLHRAEVRQFDAADPTLHPSKTKTKLAGDFLDGVAAFEKRPDFIEQFLPNGKAAARHQALLGDRFRWTNRSCGKRRRRLTASLFGLRLRDHRLKEAKLPFNGLAEVLHKMKAVSDLPCLWRALTRSFA